VKETVQLAQVCMKTLQHHNSPLIMSQCGSKGSPINIAQMVACVGQQSVSGRRCPDGFKDRTLPHFPPGDRCPTLSHCLLVFDP
jgi:DNA-directed RNA polymerase III subunit RPC1